jgi:hypothetical protein
LIGRVWNQQSEIINHQCLSCATNACPDWMLNRRALANC